MNFRMPDHEQELRARMNLFCLEYSLRGIVCENDPLEDMRSRFQLTVTTDRKEAERNGARPVLSIVDDRKGSVTFELRRGERTVLMDAIPYASVLAVLDAWLECFLALVFGPPRPA